MLILALLAAAQAPAPDCASALTQADMTECAILEFRRSDDELNRLWPEVMAQMQSLDEDHRKLGMSDKRPGYAASMLAAQRAWLAYRDAQCAIEGYGMRGGSAEAMLAVSCKAELTTERVKLLKSMQDRF